MNLICKQPQKIESSPHLPFLSVSTGRHFLLKISALLLITFALFPALTLNSGDGFPGEYRSWCHVIWPKGQYDRARQRGTLTLPSPSRVHTSHWMPRPCSAWAQQSLQHPLVCVIQSLARPVPSWKGDVELANFWCLEGTGEKCIFLWLLLL